MNKVLAIREMNEGDISPSFSQTDIAVLREQICKDLTPAEMKIFLMFCTRSGLDPFVKEIYAIKLAGKMVIQTSIDGLRLIADRTGRYAPGPESTYAYDKDGRLLSATSYVKKLTDDGTWHTVGATAFFSEYAKIDRGGQLCGLWRSMGHCMTAKCAEALALRKCFTSKMQKIYTSEEMDQAENPIIIERSENNLMDAEQEPQLEAKISQRQQEDLANILEDCDANYRKWVLEYLEKTYSVRTLGDLTVTLYDRVLAAAIKNMDEYRAKQKREFVPDTSFDVGAIDVVTEAVS